MINNGKDYSAMEVAGMLQRVAGAVTSGNLSGTVFGAPEDASSYDILASNANGMMSGFIDRYAGSMIAANRFKRIRAVGAAVGLGSNGIGMLDKIAQLNPAVANNIMGLHGANEALESMLRNANGIASATGRSLGGVLNPQQMSTNMMFAATQGALAFNNNLNEHGAVNGKFTHGLSLQQAASVANSILADRSQYEEWEKEQHRKTREWREKNPTASGRQMAEAGILTEAEATAFRHGTAMTDASVRSFNDRIKSFQKEMNGFVASVSKITGSFESAVEFLQDMTNGKAFSAGEEATRARRRAAQTAANLRVLAADAGIDPRTMYGMVKGFGDTFDAGMGKDIYERSFGNRTTAANVGAMSAAALASYMKAHPNATPEEIERVKLGLAARSEGYGQGDAVRHNGLLAEMVRRGGISESEALRLAKSGDQNAVYKVLRDFFGPAVDHIIASEPLRNMYESQNAEVTERLNKASFREGTSNERITLNQRRALNNAKTIASSMLRSVDKNAARNMENMQKEALLDTDTLKSMGLDDDKIQEFQELAKKKNWGSSIITRKLREMGVNEFQLNSRVFASMSEQIKSQYGGKGTAADQAIAQFENLRKMVTPEVTAVDIKKLRMNRLAEARSKKLEDLKAAYAQAKNEGNDAKANEILGQMHSMAEDAAAGGGDYTLKDGGFAEYMTGKFVSGKPMTQEQKSQAAIGAKNAYEKAMREGATSDEAWAAAAETLKTDYKVEGFDKFSSPEKRRELYKNYRRLEDATALFESIMNRAGIGEKDQRRYQMRAEFQKRLRSGSVFESLARNKNLKGLKGAALETEIARLAAGEVAGGVFGMFKQQNGDPIVGVKAIREFLGSKDADQMLEGMKLGTFDYAAVDAGRVERQTNGQNATKEEQDAASLLAARRSESMNAMGHAKGRALGAADEWVEAGGQQLDNANTLARVTRGDQLLAEAKNKAFGGPDAFDKDRASRLLKVSEKMGALKRMFGADKFESFEAAANRTGNKEFREAFTGKKGGKIENKNIAEYFQRLLSEGAGKSPEEFKTILENNRDKLLQLGVYNRLTEAKDDKGQLIDPRHMMQAFVTATASMETEQKRETDEKKREKMQEDALTAGYVAQSVKDGDKRLASDESLNYLKIMADALETMAYTER